MADDTGARAVFNGSAAPAAPPRPPTIRDVARVAGVSKSLVSLVFTGGVNVSEERRLRVLHAAEQLGYRPNLVAQSLSAGRRDIVAILVSNLHNPLFAEIVGAAKARLAEAGRRTMIVSAQVDDGAGGTVLDRDNLDVLRDLRPSGLITVGTIPEFSVLAELTATIPTVVASAIDSTPDVLATVRTDDVAGLDLVMAHLAGHGVESAAFVGSDGGTVSIAREAAFMSAAAHHGFGDRAWVERVRVERARVEQERIERARGGHTDADSTEASVRIVIDRLLVDGRLPQAIVAANDLTAISVISALEAAGAPVPVRCRVVGYDNTTLAAIPRISLTSVDPDNRRIGRDAAEALLAGVERPVGEMLIPPRLVVRDSA